MQRARVAVIRTSPETVVDDYPRLMEMAGLFDTLSPDEDLIIKLNLSWTRYFPACSTQPWQLDGTLKGLIEGGFKPERIVAVENKTVVTNPRKGARDNRWLPVLERYGVKFVPLPEVEWTVHHFKHTLLRIPSIFGEIEIPKMFIGKQLLHLPTLKTHGHTTTTGAVKNAFGGLLKEVRHYAHKHIHEVLVDLLMMERELHPATFALIDGTVGGNGAGPRTMIPVEVGYLLGSADSVAVDAVGAKMMGFDPRGIAYLSIAGRMQLGVSDLDAIDVVGEDISDVNLGFYVKRSLVIYGDQLIRLGCLRRFERILLHSPLVFWAPLASNIYHDWLWYPTIGRSRIRSFRETGYGRLFEQYGA
jgi:uncharacterized protein (DUF362 family)